MSHLLLELARPSRVLPRSTLERLSREENWNTLCHLIGHFELAPLIYERCCTQPGSLPTHVREWLEARHALTVNRNRILLDELHEIISTLSIRGIPVLVLKGPAFAHLSTGLSVRPFHDLDVLVKPRDLEEVAAVLRAQGYMRASSATRHYHEVFVRPGRSLATVVELHFTLVDPGRAYTPDVAGLWDRAIRLDLDGRAIATLSLPDHLLVAMMQLPHHHWNLRLVAEISTMVNRWKDVIDWEIVTERAKGWGMRALAGSTLHAVGELFRVVLPEAVERFVHPENYFRRIQWQIARHAILEQLVPSHLSTGRLAAVLLSDRWVDAISMIVRRASFADVPSGHASTATTAGRRLGYVVSSLPLLVRVLAEAAVVRAPSKPAGFAGTRLD